MKISLSIWVNVGSPLLVLPVLQTRSVFFLDCRDGWWLKNIKRHPWVIFFSSSPSRFLGRYNYLKADFSPLGNSRRREGEGQAIFEKKKGR
jgi:hypothetical protein